EIETGVIVWLLPDPVNLTQIRQVAEDVYRMFHTRYTLHRQALQHKIGYIIDIKIKEALIEADDKLKISEAIFDMEKYTNLTDHICDEINQSAPDLKKARDILDDIIHRRLPKFVGEARLKNEDKLKGDLKEKFAEAVGKYKDLDHNDFQIYVKMYKPNKVCEWIVRVYYKKAQNIQKDTKVKAEECFRTWCQAIDFTVSEAETNSNHLFDKILDGTDRHLLMFIGQAKMKEDKLKEKLKTKIVKECNQKVQGSPQLDNKDFEIYVLDMGFGEVGKEPIDNVHFYSKDNPDTAFKIEKYKVPSLKPKKFHEWLIRVYYNKTYQNDQKVEEQQKEVQERAEECFHDWCMKSNFIDNKDVSGASEESSSSGAAQSGAVVFKTSSGKIFNDPIYGQFELPDLLVKIIDTPQFQRLRHIKQLGGAYLVYPGATHTRFEHSLGSAYLAGCLAKVLQEKQKETDLKGNEITDKDVLCVQIAALCYNLGHGPFSYVFKDKIFPEVLKHDEPWEHEVASAWIFLDIVEKNEAVKKAMLDSELHDRVHLEFIQDLISSPKGGDKSFLYDIVANKQNYIDVRKWDYFARDCHYLGIPNSFDHQRMLKSARVCDVDAKKHICFRDKVADNIYDMFNTQYSLYCQAYMHKVVKIIEDKIKDALACKVNLGTQLKESDLRDDFKHKISRIIKSTPAKAKVSESINNEMENFIKLTDHIFEDILYTKDDNLKKARMTLKNVVKRHLPMCMEYRLENNGNGNGNGNKEDLKREQEADWKKAITKWNNIHPNVDLREVDFSFHVIQLNYNQKDTDPNIRKKNPINNVYFYRKKNPTKAFKIKKYEGSSLSTEEFTEYVCRVYYIGNSDKDPRSAKECFDWWRRGMCEIELYDQQDLLGTRYVSTGDCPSLDLCQIEEVHSCKVNQGVWALYMGRDYSGDHYLLRQREYHNPEAWNNGESTAPALSVKFVTK
ncbi:hypothetical protein QQF64_000313, partial [Cirrhinus molitorella]